MFRKLECSQTILRRSDERVYNSGYKDLRPFISRKFWTDSTAKMDFLGENYANRYEAPWVEITKYLKITITK